jgi:hypothetical protein
VFGIGEHHTRAFAVSSPAVVHAAIARATSHVTLTTTATVRSVLDPRKLRVGFYGTDRIGFAVSRANIAAFTAAQVENDAYLNRAPAISN